MSKHSKLYVIYAGNDTEPCRPVYKSTTKSKAMNYLHKVIMKNQEYTKVYLDSTEVHSFDKRDLYE